jgi:hypothetical protein
MIAYVHHGMAVVELAGGDYDAALAHLRAVDEIRQRWPLGLVFSGACFELYARIAIAKRDQKALYEATNQAAQAFTLFRNPTLIARYQRLMLDAERVRMTVHTFTSQAPPLRVSEPATTQMDVSTATMETESILAGCKSFDERVDKVLSLATGQSTSKNAMLYLIRDQIATLVAQRGRCPDAKRMDPLVTAFVRGEMEESPDTVINTDDLVTSTVDTADWVGPAGTQFAPALLSHPTEEGVAITGVFVFDVEGQRRPPDKLLSRLSEALVTSKDVVPLMIA